jgi:hypothetical protein
VACPPIERASDRTQHNVLVCEWLELCSGAGRTAREISSTGHPKTESKKPTLMRRRQVLPQHQHQGYPLDIFDELETRNWGNDLSSLTTEKILSRVNLDKKAVGDDDDQNESHNPFCGSVDELISTRTEYIGESFVSIYDLLSDSHRAMFLPARANLLERLKLVSSSRSGYNKKTEAIETYSWRSSDGLKTFKEGGRLSELRTGKLANWYLPFFGYCDEDLKQCGAEVPKRVCCLLCLKTLQLAKHTLIRHFRNLHADYFSVFSDHLLSQHSKWSAFKNEPLLLEWELMIAQAS